MKTAVVGGGWAGMAAAVELAHRGVPVTVFEAARQLGGRARGFAADGLTLDNGPHLLLGAYRETRRLIATVHAAAAPLWRQPLEWHIPGHFTLRAAKLPAPLHLAGALLAARGLDWRARLAAARFMAAMRRQGFRLAADLDVSAFLRAQRQPEELCRLLWEPMCLAALNTPPDEASAQIFLNVLRDALAASRSASDMLFARTDFTRLFPAPAALYVRQRGGDVRLSTAVRAITRTDDGFALTTRHGTESFRHVVCAVPPWRLPALTAHLPPLAKAARQAAALSYQPIYTVYLRYPPAARLAHAFIGVEIFGRVQWVFDRGATHGQAGLMAVVLSAEGAHTKLAHDALARTVGAALAPHVAPAGLAPHWQQVVAEKRATFACTPGLARPSQTTPLPGFHLAGDYTAGDYPATLEGAVQSGVACARAITGG